MALELRSRRSLRASVPRRPVLLLVAFLVTMANTTTSRGDDVVLEGRTMGTTWTIRLTDGVRPQENASLAEPSELRETVQQELDRLEGIFSLYRADSEISRWNDQSTTDWIDVSEDFAQVTLSALDVAARTGGAFDPTIEPLGRLWGIREIVPISPPAQPLSRTDLPQVGFRLIEASLTPPRVRKSHPAARLDLNALVEGYAIDRLAEILQSRGVDSALVGLGGEFRGIGQTVRGEPWRIAIESPHDPKAILARVPLQDGAVSTSGTYRQERQQADGAATSHIFDGRTLSPVRHDTISVTVVAETALEADRWSTALLALGATEGRAVADTENLAALFVHRAPPVVELSTPGRSRIRLPISDTPEGDSPLQPAPRFSWGYAYVAAVLILVIARTFSRWKPRGRADSK